MGNSVPRMCHDATVAADGTLSRNAGATPARRRGGKVVRRRRVEQKQQEGGGGGGITVARVKMVLTRKEAEKLIARLEESYGARERKARMAELTGQLRAGDGGGGGGGRTPETWKPRLMPIQEN